MKVIGGDVAGKIEKMQRPVRLEDATNLVERRLFLRRRQVVEHQRRENEIEGRLGVRQLIREAAIELDGDAFSLRLASRSRKGLLIEFVRRIRTRSSA